MVSKQVDSSLKEILRELRAENRRLQTKIAKLEAKEISQKNRIAALDREIESGSNRALKKLMDEIHARGSRLPIREQPIEPTLAEGGDNMTGSLTNANHDRMDDFLKRVLNAYKVGEVSLESAVAGLAQVMAALDKGNTGEAIAWFESEGISRFKK